MLCFVFNNFRTGKPPFFELLTAPKEAGRKWQAKHPNITMNGPSARLLTRAALIAPASEPAHHVHK